MITAISLPLFLIVLSGLFFAYFIDKYSAFKEQCQRYGHHCGYMKFVVTSYAFLAVGGFLLWATLYPGAITKWGDVLAYSAALILVSAVFSRPRTKKGFVWWMAFISICRTVGVTGLALIFAIQFLF